jgi:hypothetical protein
MWNKLKNIVPRKNIRSVKDRILVTQFIELIIAKISEPEQNQPLPLPTTPPLFPQTGSTRGPGVVKYFELCFIKVF